MARKTVAAPKGVTVVVDSGLFLPRNGSICEIGFFQGEPTEDDIEIKVDGKTVKDRSLVDVGQGNCVVEIQHRNADGKPREDGIRVPVPFREQLLHMKELYGKHVAVKRENFDCILCFKSGALGVEDVRERKFNRYKKLANGKLATKPFQTKPSKPIAHDLVVRFELADDESIALTRNGVEFWSIKGSNVKEGVDIRFNAGDSTTEKFYRRGFQAARRSYFLPNPGDPPPSCPNPPCQDGGLNG